MSGYSNLKDFERLWFNKKFIFSGCSTPLPIIALLRIRNEALILSDTLDHLSKFVDAICVYDDASTDESSEILMAHEKVSFIIRNHNWESDINDRLIAETRHRALLWHFSRQYLKFNWCIYCDADERFIGPIRDFVIQNPSITADAIRIRLYDAYMTENDYAPYKSGHELLNFRRYFGPEYRDILMMWKNLDSVYFAGLDAREPKVSGLIETNFYCQHYGKSLSIEHWEETCDYYAKHFPWDTYGAKWNERRGKAIHTLSDFNRPLYSWDEALFSSGINMIEVK